MKLWDRVAFYTDATGTSGPLNVGLAIRDSLFTPAEAGVEDGQTGIHYIISQGQDVEQCTGDYATGTPPTLTRTTVKSKIAGVVGTDPIDLNGNAIVRFVADASWFEDLLDSSVIDTDSAMTNDSDELVPSQKAVKAAITASAASATSVATIIHAVSSKSTPVDADELALIDSAASNVLKKLTWANLKATLKTYLDTLYQPLATILTAIAALSSTGLIARTGSGAVSVRTITGTANKIAVTNGSGAGGDPVINVGSSVALLDTAAQSLSGGARVVTYDNGTKSSGTFTPDPGNGPQQKATNNGAHTLAPGTNYGSYFLDYTNGASAGAITTSGFTKVSGDAFDTTNGHKFSCHIKVSEIGSTLTVQAMS